ncbi:MAG: DeoR family transcriptional regulator, partial [Spirochaetaceae bacterium]
MTHIPRHTDILKVLSLIRTVTVGELASRLDVSEVTIRKDLSILEEM